jgi:hypothetical protein
MVTVSSLLFASLMAIAALAAPVENSGNSDLMLAIAPAAGNADRMDHGYYLTNGNEKRSPVEMLI